MGIGFYFFFFCFFQPSCDSGLIKLEGKEKFASIFLPFSTAIGSCRVGSGFHRVTGS